MEQNLRNVVEFLLAGMISLFLALMFLIPTGISPIEAIQSIFVGSFSDIYHVSTIIKYVTVFILTGLAVLIPYKARVTNIGGEGQIYMAALGGIWVSIVLGQNGNVVLIFLTAALFGALWAGIAGVLKAKFNADESVTTIFLNAIAYYIVSYSVSLGGPFRDTTQSWNQSWPIPSWGRLDFYYGTILALVLLFLTFFLFSRTKIGYAIRVLGGNPLAAEYIHLNKGKLAILSLLAGGAMAGLAGAYVITCMTYYLQVDFSANYGYWGIGVAAIVSFDTLLLIPSALLFSMFSSGMKSLTIRSRLSETIIPVLIGITILISIMRRNPKLRNRLEQIVMWISKFWRKK